MVCGVDDSARDRLIIGMRELMRTKGFAATGINELVAVSRSPKGSIYHYFPGGKDQIAAEAIRRSGDEAAGATRAAFQRHRTPRAAVRAIIEWQIDELVASDFGVGCPIAAATLDAASRPGPVREACRDAYESWQNALAEGLSRRAVLTPSTRGDAAVLLSAIEGALLLCRAERSTAALGHLMDRIDSLVPRAAVPRPKESEQ